MYNLNKKQKIIIIILLIILCGGFCYYVYTKDNNIIEDNINSNAFNENQEETTNTEEIKISTIVVHVSGAVNKEGIVELAKNLNDLGFDLKKMLICQKLILLLF